MAEAGSALFADLLGQPRAVSLLEAALARDRLAPASATAALRRWRDQALLRRLVSPTPEGSGG